MSQFKKSFTIACLLLALILTVGCEKDSLPIEEAEMLTIDEKIEKQFSMDAFEDPSGTIKDNLEIN